ncbi:hypothetical protein TPB0596_12220 [Tsukamurella pulmonis]|uniref:hypothetical protein n=1 Tax=Tsukamurella pulmonis TaxID=47312 RepID=UPI001EDE8692|nr:hypothetical protein [Tsukamurella pulmonis]BDD81459.1 hypothetical protein TPB0596_12220 [Tsukamurella pulmonis]
MPDKHTVPDWIGLDLTLAEATGACAHGELIYRVALTHLAVDGVTALESHATYVDCPACQETIDV